MKGEVAPTVARNAKPEPSLELMAASERAREPCSQSCASTGSVNLPYCSWAAMPSSTSRSEEHTSELQSLMRISYAVFCLKKKRKPKTDKKQVTRKVIHTPKTYQPN